MKQLKVQYRQVFATCKFFCIPQQQYCQQRWHYQHEGLSSVVELLKTTEELIQKHANKPLTYTLTTEDLIQTHANKPLTHTLQSEEANKNPSTPLTRQRSRRNLGGWKFLIFHLSYNRRLQTQLTRLRILGKCTAKSRNF